MKNCKGCKDLFSAWCWYIVFWIIMVETGCCSRQVRGELKYLKFDEVLDKQIAETTPRILTKYSNYKMYHF